MRLWCALPGLRRPFGLTAGPSGRTAPRHTRRALQGRLAQSLAGVAVLLALGHGPALAATINVTGGCTLITAITAANTESSVGGCPAGSGADTIVLAANSVHTLTASNNSTFGPTGLPVVSSVIVIAGNSSRIERDSGAPAFRILAINSSGDLTLQDTTLSGGVATGGFPANAGGEMYNRGALTLTHSTVSGNTADGYGGGVENVNSSHLTLVRTVVSGNTGGSSGQEIDNFTATADGTAATALSAILNPLLDDNGGPTQTHAVVSGSPALDASPADATCPPRDQRGVLRPQGAACDIGAFELSLEVHDLAVTNVIAPPIAILTAAKPVQTKKVSVQIQNRSPQAETVTTVEGLVHLTLEPLVTGSCAPSVAVSATQIPLPTVLAPKQKMNVNLDVTFDCALDGAKSAPKTFTHHDFGYTAIVDHAAIDGQPDTHLDDDECPRLGLGIVPNPDGTIHDKGCVEKLTDVVDKR